MPKGKLELAEDTEGHMPWSRLDQASAEVTVRFPEGEVKGNLSREGDDLIFEAPDDTDGQAFKKLDQASDVTVRFEDGDEVQGHWFTKGR